MKNCFISTYPGQCRSVADILVKGLCFEHVQLKGKCYPSISSKKILFIKEFRNCVNSLIHLKEFNGSNILISPNYVMLFLLLLRKLHILKVDTLVWYGVYIHNPKMITAMGKVIPKLLKNNQKFKIILFSRAEKDLYANAWHISEDNFISVPLGEWDQGNDEEAETERCDEGYFFSGGYSNRDYVSLIKLFNNRKERLVIAASKQNSDLTEYIEKNSVSENITLFYDISQEEFTDLLMKSRATIFIMMHDTGASGQMVVLNAMKHRKLVIATKTDVLNEYIENNVSGIVVNKEEMFSALPDIIAKAERDIGCYNDLIENAYEKYELTYSYTAISRCFITCIEEIQRDEINNDD
jgi:glycosyltransferase involved in cell wall biosynthesis